MTYMKALIFDLDGTVFDTAASIVRSLNAVRSANSWDPLPLEFAKSLVGLHPSLFIEDLDVTILEENKFVKDFRRHLADTSDFGSSVFPDAIKFINDARTLGFLLATATTKPTALAEEMISKSPAVNLFDVVQGTDDFQPKPNPEVIHRALKRLGASDGVMFGDRVEDMLAAKNAGLTAIGVRNGGPHSRVQLLEAGASAVYEEFSAIDPQVFKIGK